MSLALGAEATFVARTLDSDRKHLTSVLRAAADHQGTALVEIYQNCNIFNDGAFDLLKDADTRDDWTIPLRARRAAALRPVADDGSSKAVVRTATGALTVEDDVAADDPRVVVHDAHADDPSYAFALSRLSANESRYTPMGVFRSVVAPDLRRADGRAARPGGRGGTGRRRGLREAADRGRQLADRLTRQHPSTPDRPTRLDHRPLANSVARRAARP